MVEQTCSSTSQGISYSFVSYLFFTSVSFYVLLMCGEVMTLDMQCIHKCSDAQTSEKGMGTLTEADSCFCQDDI